MNDMHRSRSNKWQPTLGRMFLGVWCIWGLLVVSAGAAERGLYETMGAPPNPRVSAQWNRYHDYAEATQLLKAMADAHPRRAHLQSLGRSHGGREMWLLTITNFDSGDDRSKSAFWIDAGIHANEVQGAEVALYTAWYLLEMDGRVPFITELLAKRAFYILPMLSPDSRDAHMHEPASTHAPRSGLRPVDDDRDGLVDEDGPDDLDRDGHITQMRIADPNGRWKPHPDYPQLMIPAEPDERGQYTLLGSEGIDNDGDGRIDEDGPGYYDPNRDWAWNWQPRGVQAGAYRYPFSIAENRMAADFVIDHPNIAGAQSYHNAGGLILRGPGAKEEQFAPADVAVFDALAKKGELVLPGYRYVVIGKDMYTVYGGEIDWFYAMRGVFTFTNELFTAFNYFRKPSEKGWFGREEDARAFDKYLLFSQGTVPWKKVLHPQLGEIEVGGLKKNWLRQPPSFLLEEECHRNMAFTLYHADQMPLVEVQSVRTRPAANGLTEVTATISNRRMIPTRAAVDVQHQVSPPDKVRISGKELRVIAGLQSSDPFFRAAKEQKLKPEELRVSTIPGMSAVYVRWLVEGQGPYRVSVSSAKGGRSQATSP